MNTQIKTARHIHSVSIHAPICQNHSFKLAVLDAVFAVWRERGIRSFLVLYIDGQFASFVQLSTKFNLPTFFTFFTIKHNTVKHYVKEECPHFRVTSTTPPFLEKLLLPPDSSQLISIFVNCFTCVAPMDFMREAWATGLNSEISAELWEEATSQIHHCSVNLRYRLIQYR